MTFHWGLLEKDDSVTFRYDSLRSFCMSNGTLFDFHIVKIDILSSPFVKSPHSLAAVNQPVIPERLAQLIRQTLPKCHKPQTRPVDSVPLRENHGKSYIAACQALEGPVEFECLPEP